jgi:prepilin-type N-terminal cleavage/methylation domain-containing protein
VKAQRSGFTLLELLVVVAIMVLLIGILLPSLGRARQRAITVRCMANLHGIGRGLMLYQSDNDGYVVPSYNMPRAPGGGCKSSAAAGDLIDGWAAILDRAGVVPASPSPTNNIFFCPNTLDLSGMDGGQTLYDQNKPNGYQNWPIQFTSAGGDGATKTVPTLPIPNFTDGNLPYEHLLRCGYWLNAQNPIGSAPPASPASPPPCPYYTQCVGYGPYADGTAMPPVRASLFVRPQALIVATDGMYMGRNSVTRLGEQNRRVGYRHPGPTLTVKVNGTNMTFDQTVSNAVLADGHAESINSIDFPHGNVLAENSGRYSLLSGQ